MIDWLIRIAILYAMAFVTMFFGGFGFAFWLILFFLLDWFYPVAFELGRDGATPGKRAMGLKVVMDNGLPVTPAASMTRNLLRFADFMPLLYGAATVCMLTRADGKRLGDLAAATHGGTPAPPRAQGHARHGHAGGAGARALDARPVGGHRAGGARAHAHHRTPRRARGARGLGAGRGARAAGRGDAPGARRGAMVVRTAHMTPLHFENLYQKEWDELANALAPILDGRKRKSEKLATRFAASAWPSCTGAPASTSRWRGRATTRAICSTASTN